ncbi:YIP1 family protein [Paenibacillus sp. VCA1]|uniref:YIP1 family protein n=1 Tax=Paenibacillus sp. VCA1 TaxID=3039148 RepID=UPI0028714A55|nr:YIP1 family protein [Paenibacillus sp. VCA1]MDR9855722.1 YIP1 family protein [Paenibacillus sp. VCA1]
MKRIWTTLLLLLAVSIASQAAPAAAAPYYGYNYSSTGEALPAPLPYLPAKVIYGKDVSAGAFNNPEDVFVDSEKLVYVADTGNNRIVVMDSEWRLVRIIDSFRREGRKDTFNQPKGVFVDKAGHVYVADTNNGRIVELGERDEFVREIGAPKSDVIRKDFKFVPTKLALDSAKRLFVVSQGVFDGILEYDAKGQFTGFFGKNPVRFTASELFWKQFSTEAQRQQMALFVPIEFNNLAVDSEQFVYATASENSLSSEMVKRLNPSGTNVLRHDGFPVVGDLRVTQIGSFRGSTTLTSVAVNNNGIYLVLDSKRGRTFAYDYDGNLLFQFGQIGDKEGTFRTPVEVEWFGDDILVLDRSLNRLTLFKPTRYGSLVLDAASAYYNGKEETATRLWNEVGKLNHNLELAHVGIGRAELEQGEYKQAMASFKLGGTPMYYSKAFEGYRKIFLWDNFTYLFIGLAVAIVAVVIGRRLIPKTSSDDYGPVRTAFFTTVRPFKMFWELKYEGRGKLWVAVTIVMLVGFVFVLRAFYSGYLVTNIDWLHISSVKEFSFVIIPFFVWCLANWSLTTLMDGEGKFRDIVIASGYAMLPLLIVYALQLVFSWVITQQEMAFYLLLGSVGTLWFILLLFVATMTVHQYTPLKTVITMILTVVVIAIIIFLALLLFSLIQQLVVFVSTVYRELSLW